MDPNAWPNYNPQYNGPPNTGHQGNRYDLQLLEQQGSLSSQLSPSLGGMPTAHSLPGHSPAVPYGSHIPSSSQFLDSALHMQPSYAPQQPYKPSLAQPGYQIDPLMSQHQTPESMPHYLQSSLNPPSIGSMLLNPSQPLLSPTGDPKSWGIPPPNPLASAGGYPSLQPYGSSLHLPSTASNPPASSHPINALYPRVADPGSHTVQPPYQPMHSPQLPQAQDLTQQSQASDIAYLQAAYRKDSQTVKMDPDQESYQFSHNVPQLLTANKSQMIPTTGLDVPRKERSRLSGNIPDANYEPLSPDNQTANFQHGSAYLNPVKKEHSEMFYSSKHKKLKSEINLDNSKNGTKASVPQDQPVPANIHPKQEPRSPRIKSEPHFGSPPRLEPIGQFPNDSQTPNTSSQKEAPVEGLGSNPAEINNEMHMDSAANSVPTGVTQDTQGHSTTTPKGKTTSTKKEKIPKDSNVSDRKSLTSTEPIVKEDSALSSNTTARSHTGSDPPFSIHNTDTKTNLQAKIGPKSPHKDTPETTLSAVEPKDKVPILVNQENSEQDKLDLPISKSSSGDIPVKKGESLPDEAKDSPMEISDAPKSNKKPLPDKKTEESCKFLKVEKKVEVVTSALEFDEDFQHLASPAKNPLPDLTKASANKTSTKDAKFLGSFLSFIDGDGEQTKNPQQKPSMPKYISEENKVSSKVRGPAPVLEEDIPVIQAPNPEVTTGTPVDSETTENPLPTTSKKSARGRGRGRGRKRKQPLDDLRDPGSNSETERVKTPEPEGPSTRRRSSRRIKEVIKSSYVEADSSEDIDHVDDDKDVVYSADEVIDDDSDEDPGWNPSATDKKSPLTLPPRGRRRSTKPAKKPKNSTLSGRRRGRVYADLSRSDFPDKTDQPVAESPTEPVKDTNGAPTETPPPPPPATVAFPKGSFLIEKKDLTCYENYPIWKVTEGNMLQKYELVVEDGKVKHKSTFAFCRLTPLMNDQFQKVVVNLSVRWKSSEIVCVREEDKPKPPTDGRLEREYEGDPFVEHFNVFLQILLSQALEEGFLGAIRKSTDTFYADHMAKVDELISDKVLDIEQKMRWYEDFKESVKCRPQLRTLDRPHLKQFCQACQGSKEAAIKSVHLFGSMYDKTDLVDVKIQQTNSSISQEFLVGKTAATHLPTYHSLIHYKYNLYNRCKAKVILVKGSEKTSDNAEILDSCLNHRAWVLKLYEDLKSMLEEET